MTEDGTKWGLPGVDSEKHKTDYKVFWGNTARIGLYARQEDLKWKSQSGKDKR